MKNQILIHQPSEEPLIIDGADRELRNEIDRLFGQEEECPECGKTIDECHCYSPCCGAPIVFGDLCSDCREHCI